VKQLFSLLASRSTASPATHKPTSTDESPSLKLNFVWVILGNLVYGISQILLFWLISKLGNSELLGHYTLAVAIVAPTIMFANLHLRTLQATDSQGRYRFRDYFELRCVMVVAALMFMGLLGFVGLGPQKGLILALLGLSKAVEAISELFYGALQQQECLERISKSLVIRNLIGLFSFALLFYQTRSLPIALLGLIGSALLVLLAYDVRGPYGFLKDYDLGSGSPWDRLIYGIGLWSKPTWPIILDLFKNALPVGVMIMLLSLCTNIPRYFIEYYRTSSELGVFAAGIIVISACGQSALPRLAKYYASVDPRRFRKLTLQLLSIAIGLGLGGYLMASLLGKPLLTLLYSSEYAEQNVLFSRLMLWGGLHYTASLLGSAVAAAQYFRSTLVLAAVRTVVTIVTSALFIHHYGLQGAVLSLVVDEIVQLVGLALLWNHAFNRIRILSRSQA
jgi:O-antigen/teichoic acid export membrane protein